MSLELIIKKKFGAFNLDINFKAKGLITGLLGSSGSGKTLTLKCIAGIEKPECGKIILNGKTLFDSEKNINVPPEKREIGYVFQSYALFPNMTVSENIMAGIKGTKAEKEKMLSDVLSFFDLEKVKGKYPSEASGGEAQRCALARIFVRKPKLILLDEPFSGIDSFMKYRLEEDLFRFIKKLGIPVIFVSHDKGEIYRRCESICVLNEGKSLRIKEKDELFKSPEHISEAKLIGIRNFFECENKGDFMFIRGLDIKVKCAKECKFIGIHQKNIRFSKGQGDLELKAFVKNVTCDMDKNIVSLDINGVNVFAETRENVLSGYETKVYINEESLLFLNEI